MNITGRNHQDISSKEGGTLWPAFAQIAAVLTAIPDADEMLQAAVDLVKETFGLYHASIYLLNSSGDMLSLACGAGEVGSQMADEGCHFLLAENRTMAARVAATRQGAIIQDVCWEPDFQAHPMLPDTRSVMVIPLLYGDNLTGVLEVQDSTPNRFTAEEFQVMAALSVQIAASLQHGRAFARIQRLAEQSEQALAETELLNRISTRLSAAQSLEDALACLSETAGSAAARDSRLFSVSLNERVQPEGLTLSAVWYPEYGPQIVPVSSYFLLSDYPAYWQLLQNPYTPLLVEDVQADPRLEEATVDLFNRSGARAVAVLPLVVNGRWVGIVMIHWEQPHAFSRLENRLYTSLARQAAVVVNNRSLLEQTRKRAQELQIVAQVSTAASTILDPQELLQAVVNLTKSSFNLLHVQIHALRPVENLLQVVACSLEAEIDAEQRSFWTHLDSSSAVARAARERQVTIVNDIQADVSNADNQTLPGVRSEMALPVVVGERLMGVFHVQAGDANRFSSEDARVFTTLASQMAVAWQNAELYAEQAATVERLRELDHLKSAFLANMSHELRTPLNSILGFAEVLLLGLDGPLNETMVYDIRLIEKNGKHLLSLINDVLDMAKIEAGKMSLTLEKFFLRELLEETVDITASLAREKSLYLEIEPDSADKVYLVADRVRLRQVLINVIANSVKFTEKGGISIRTIPLLADNRLCIQVKDTGIGIPSEKLEQIFDSFSQVDTSTTRKSGGTGLGLPISRRLVEMHGGRLWAESAGANGNGSKFIIELPLDASTSGGK